MKLKSNLSFYIFIFSVLYIVVPAPIKLLILIFLLFIVFKKPEVAAIILIATSLFDQYYIIPFWGRSITLLIFPVAIISLIFNNKLNKSIKTFLPYLSIFSMLIIYSTSLGYETLSSYGGFADPSRGIVFFVSILYISLIFYSINRYKMILEIRNMLWIVPYLFLLSIPLSFFLYPDYFGEMRFQGTFGDPNYFARYAMLSLLITLFAFEKGYKKYLLIIIISIFIILSASKTAFVVFVLFLFYYFFKEKSRHKVLVLSAIFLFFIALLFTDIPNLLISRFTLPSSICMGGIKIYNPIDILTTGRTYLWRFFINEFNFKDSIFYIGSGIGTSSIFFIPLLSYTLVAHNSFIEILIDIGTIGFILLFFTLIKIQRIPKKIGIPMLSIYPYLLIIFIFYNSTLSGFWVKQNIAIIFLILLSYGIQNTTKT